jgi:type II secretory pathway pseudopilin PulG
MNTRQKAILINIVIILLVTIIAVLAMFNLRDYFNRRAATFAMMVLGSRIKNYRTERGSVPSESWVEDQRETLPGRDRLGELHYRGRWIDFESDPNEILAYSEKRSRSIIFTDGYLVLRLKEVLGQDAEINIEWLEKQEFEDLLAQQQSPMETEMQYK